MTKKQLENPRKRSYGSTVPSGMDRKIYNHLGQLTSTTTNQLFGNRQGETGLMTDIVVPDYKKRVAAGQIINNPMTRRVTLCQPANGPWTVWNSNGSRVEFSGTDSVLGPLGHVMPSVDGFLGFGPSLPGYVDEADLQHQAAIKALSRVNASEALSLVTLAEVGKTVGMITSTVGAMSGAISDILKGSPKKRVLGLLGIKQNPKQKATISWGGKTSRDKWLELRYGWTPLLYDLEGTMNALAKVHYPRFTARGFANNSATKDTNATVSIDPTFGHSCLLKTVEKLETNVRAYVLYEADRNWFLPARLGALAPLTTVWELVPFSFVVDWFVDVGGWLDAITPRIGVKTLAHGTVTQSVYTWTKSIVSTSSGVGSSITGLVGQKGSYTCTGVNRVTTVELPLVPPIDVKLNVKRGIDAIALLAQQASKLR